jgi:anhydro-N-acetylmuramic acid kinase
MNSGHHVIGLMSGTSLDGLDIAYCFFEKKDNRWVFEIRDTRAVSYNAEWREKLSNAYHISGEALMQLHHELGELHGKWVSDFIASKNHSIDFIASHGHTIFHRPKDGWTLQIGSPSAIASICKLPVIADFRTLDVTLGGQGAPLVPIGDRLLFSSFEACLNLGGISNISFEKNEERIAFDIAPCNMMFNFLAEKMNIVFDEDGHIARSGKVIQSLLDEWNALSYYHSAPPKSLGREFFEANFLSKFQQSTYNIADLMCTAVEHGAFQIACVLNDQSISKVLVTGGGAKHHFFIERVKAHTNCEIHIPSKEIIDFKEALVFAFLGVLRYRGEVNTLASVTGASRDSIGGAIWNP